MFGNIFGVYFTENNLFMKTCQKFKESIILSIRNHNWGRKTVYIESSAGLCPDRKSFLQAVKIYSQ